MLAADNVIDLMGEARVLLMDEAVFTPPSGPLGYSGT